MKNYHVGMWERTITVSSCGKTFSMTGWKVGWAYGHKYAFENFVNIEISYLIMFPLFRDVIQPIMLANQWIQYCVSTPTCRALSYILEQADQPYEGFPSYYAYICAEYQRYKIIRNRTINQTKFKYFCFLIIITESETISLNH
jgi:kynurenine---oxoglutarate transaminase / cysteine-S-conjugate beta-lyase / glutamine---phenylpyruvate transaminase